MVIIPPIWENTWRKERRALPEGGQYLHHSFHAAGAEAGEITQLLQAENFRPVLVDAAAQSDVETFCDLSAACDKGGKRIFDPKCGRASQVLGNISDRPLLDRQELLGAEADEAAGENYGGIVPIGSHVKKQPCSWKN